MGAFYSKKHIPFLSKTIIYQFNKYYTWVSKIVHLIKMFQKMLEIRDSSFKLYFTP